MAIAGAGIGLRLPHVQEILTGQNDSSISAIPWFEVLVDNWLVDGGLNKDMLLSISERYPLVFHSVGLSLGGINPLDMAYLQKIKTLKQRTGALWYSEHVSFSGNQNRQVPDLLPLPYTEESVNHLSQRIQQVQEFMGERLLIENVSSYIRCQFDEMTEAEFLAAVAEQADCYLLLDINNVYVNCINFEQDMTAFFNTIPAQRVKQIHLAGFQDKGDYLLDAHNNPVSDSVWEQFEQFVARHGPIPSMIEWDNDLPTLDRLLDERSLAEKRLNDCTQDPAREIFQCA